MRDPNDSMNCDAFRDLVADRLEGELDPAALDHLADCDDCRDLRHDARALARRLSEAGADYVAPEPDALVARLMASLDARAAAPAAAPVAAPQAPPRASAETVDIASNVSQAPPAEPAVAKTVVMPQAQEEKVIPALKRPEAEGAKVLTLRQRRLPAWAYGGILTLGTLAAAAWVVGVRSPADPPASTEAASAMTAAWDARVARVVGPRDGSAGVEVMRPGGAWERVQAGATRYPAGSRLRTDPRTRCRVELNDGTVLALDRGTTVTLDRAAIRRLRLDEGTLVADVAHREAQHAQLETAHGTVEVLGTKFALTATEQRTLVRVSRGVVKLGEGGSEVTVAAGQEGVVERGREARVGPAINLASSLAWSELGPLDSAERDAPLVGLGELRARRPGQTQERDEAVHLRSHSVKVRIVGNVARTEVEEVFRNDTGNELEGIYRFPVPPEALMEDLALDVDGAMQSGAFVARDRAAAIWRGVIRNATPRPQQTVEEYVWVPGPWRDPALLEWQRGGRSELRVFPIPARGERRVRLTYTQTLAPSGGLRRYVYPLPHDPAASTRVDRFDVDVQVLGHDAARGVSVRGYPLADVVGDSPAGARRMRLSQSAFVPSGDLAVEYALPDAGRPMTAWGYQGAEAPSSELLADNRGFVTLALRPELPRTLNARPRDYVFVVDASRSMVGERWSRVGRLVGAIVSEMDPRDRLTVLACDARCNAMPGGLVGADSDAARDAIRFLQRVEPAGASDLVGMIDQAVRVAEGSRADRALRVVYLGDGIATAGFRRTATLERAVRESVGGRPDATVTAVSIGAGDTAGLESLAQAGGGVLVPYAPGERLDTAALNVLEATFGVVLRDPVVELPGGLRDGAPQRLANLRAGGELLVHARADAPSVQGDVVLRGSVDGAPFEARYPLAVAVQSDAGNAFVPRLYAAARVADLDASPEPNARAEAVALSQRYRVSSRHTSLLVLESEAMFRAFGIDRSVANSETWTGETASTGVNSGTLAAAAEPDDEVGAGAGEAEPTGLLGASGQGLGGAGRGDTSIGRERRSRAGGLDDLSNTETQRQSAVVTATPSPAAPTARPMRAEASAAAPAPSVPADAVMPGRVVGGSFASLGRRGPGQWMRRTWVRRAALSAARDEGDYTARIETARRNLLANPDSRDRHRELYRWLSLGGALGEADQVVDRWLGRDPLDVDALAAKADLLARNGDREGSVRVLSGVVDVRPEDLAAHERLALLYDRSGEPRAACAHRIAAAEIRADEGHLGAALGCARAQHHSDAAELMRNTVSDLALRGRLASAAPPSGPVDLGARGELTASARWSGGVDLDLVLIDPQGRRFAWATSRGVTVGGPLDLSHEELGVARASTGDWRVEVVRNDLNGPSVSGSVSMVALGERRSWGFTLAQGVSRAAVGSLRVTREAQLVPAW